MAKCSWCSRSGWFLRVSDSGLCDRCDPIVAHEVSEAVRIIQGSLKVISDTSNLKTLVSRADLASKHIEGLKKFEARGVSTIDPPPSKFLVSLGEARDERIREILDADLVQARTKSQNAATPAGKLSPYNKILDKIGMLYSEVDDVSFLEAVERGLRVELDGVQLRTQLEKAEKLAFKGQKKKAIDAYMDALFLITKDSIDDRSQTRQVSQIKNKIRELGGTPPD